MDFKSLCVLIAFVALGAGIFKGWSEYQLERQTRDLSAGIDRDVDTVTASGSRKTRAPEGSRPASPLGDERRPRSSVADPQPLAVKPRPDPAMSLVVSADDEARLAALDALLVKHDFARATEDARVLVDETRGMARARAQQVEGKARIFAALVPPESEKILEFQEVVNANRAVFVVRHLEDRFDHYRMVLVSGVVTDMKKEDVIEVRPADSKSIRKKLAKKLRQRIEKYDEPINLYLRGVRKLYRLGLRKEGLRVLNRLLEMRDGDLVLAVLAADESETLLPYWNLARGSTVTALKKRAERAAIEAASRVAVPGGVPVASAIRDGDGSGDHLDRLDRASDVVDLSPSEDAPTGPLDEAEFEKVLTRVRQADEVFLAASRANDGKSIKKAFNLFSAEQEVLYRMPDDDRVRSLRRKVTQRIFDAYKSLPFDAE